LVRKRDICEDELALWEAATRDVRRNRRVAAPKVEAKPGRVKVRESLPAVALPSSPKNLARREPPPIGGVDGSTAERLRRGRIEPDATLDLHGLTQQQAFARLIAFVRRGHENGSRLLLVITGKGSEASTERGGARGFVMPERSKAGVLRSVVPVWLEQAETRPLVVGVQSAHPRHGGGGALYVYLRRKTRSR
jgi:DNA-nicking Smr family endonuclease